MSSRNAKNKSLPLWFRSAIVVALIVLTSSLQNLSESLESEESLAQQSTDSPANSDEIERSHSNTLINRDTLSLNLKFKERSSQKTTQQESAATPTPDRFAVGDIVFGVSRTDSQRWTQRLAIQLGYRPAYDRVGVVTTKPEDPTEEFLVVYAPTIIATGAKARSAVTNAQLSHYLDQVDPSSLIIYRQKAATPEAKSAIATAANHYHQQSLNKSVSCSQLMRSLALTAKTTADQPCLSLEQLSNSEQWQQIDLRQPVRAVQSSLD